MSVTIFAMCAPCTFAQWITFFYGEYTFTIPHATPTLFKVLQSQEMHTLQLILTLALTPNSKP